DRLIYQARLQARYGRSWRRKAPVEALMPLKLAKIGVPLVRTASEGLTAAGLSPVLLPSRPEPELTALLEAPELPTARQRPVEHEPVPATESFRLAETTAEVSDGVWPEVSEPALIDLFLAARYFIAQCGTMPSAEQFAGFLARDYGLTDPVTGGLLPGGLLEPVLAELRQAEAGESESREGLPVDEAPTAELLAAPTAAGSDPDTAVEPQPFFGEQLSLRGLAGKPLEETPVSSGAVLAPTASAFGGGLEGPAGRPSGQSAPGAPVSSEEPQDWMADVTATGEATARVPRQQSGDEPAEDDPIQREIEQVAAWLAEAEDASIRLSGAEVGRRLGVSPKTGQRRVIDATRHLEEQRKQ
ncbi:hypothetical protein ACFY04_40940, partial [Streptomyces sp. NPDC001549]